MSSEQCDTKSCVRPLGHSGVHLDMAGAEFYVQHEKALLDQAYYDDAKPTFDSKFCRDTHCVLNAGHTGSHESATGAAYDRDTPKPKDRKPVNDQPTGTGEFDAVSRPVHYNAQVPPTDKHPQGIECIDVITHFELAVGNAMKYLWRAGQKGDYIEDLDKAIAFIEFAKYKEQQRRKREA